MKIIQKISLLCWDCTVETLKKLEMAFRHSIPFPHGKLKIFICDMNIEKLLLDDFFSNKNSWHCIK